MITTYGVARAICRFTFSTVWRMRVIGVENVPPDGPLIVACNHVAFLDPPVLGSAMPRPVAYMAKRELFAIPVLGPLIGKLHAFPVDRSRGDVAAIRRALEELKRGETVGVFPEGTRNRAGDAELHEGAAFLASLSGAPVLPAFVAGTGRARQLAQISVTFGRPIRFAHEPAAPGENPKQARRAEVAKWTGEIMDAVRALGECTG